MKKSDFNLDGFYEDLAGRFSALGQFLGQHGSPETAQQLFESLMSENTEDFARLIEPIEIPNIPKLGKCFWVREILERVVMSLPTLVEACVLRSDLTPRERVLYLTIALRFVGLTQLSDFERVMWRFNDGPEIPPGPFLDELKANGLVICKLKPKYDVSITLALGKPERSAFESRSAARKWFFFMLVNFAHLVKTLLVA